ncbi:MAG: prepilin-type N-terminal cleavage/methylation domain-containing protein [Burkholderiales bacterium]|nr:prepilin-type N-terminal cleavage/methylation domain-containing protein [Burkholderiales bacterium]
MDSTARGRPSRGAPRGFTVIEVLITMVVLGVLMAVAFPSFQSSIRKSRRSEAITALTNIQQAQERHRSTNASFIANITAAPPTGLGQPATRTSSGYYDLSVSGNTATAYVATATAVAGTSQANDGNCAVLAVQMSGGNVKYGAGASIDWSAANTDPNRCWAR